jgi:outer membrane receptor for ferrienterochelin and colicins
LYERIIIINVLKIKTNIAAVITMPSRFKKVFSFTILLALSILYAKGQFSIKLVDSTLKPIEFETVNIAPIVNGNADYTQGKSYTTDANGMVKPEFGGQCLVKIASTNGFAQIEKIITLEAGQTYTFTLRPIEGVFEEVVVISNYEPTSADGSTQKIKVIDAEQIKAQGAFNLKDALSNQLNVRIKQDGILGSGLSLQGIGGQNIKILVDGVPLIGRLDGNIDLSQINLNNVERIEIVEGPMSVMYGTDALGGVINLITKKPEKHTIEGNLNTYYESVGNYNIDGRVAVKGPKTNFQVNAGRNFFDGFGPTGLNGRVLQWKPKEQYFADAIFGFKIKNSTHRLQSSFFNELLLSKGEPTVTAYSAYAFDNYYTTRRINNSLYSDFTLKNGARINIINSYSWFSRSNIQKRKDLVTLEEQQTQGATDNDTSIFVHYLSRGTYTNIRKNKKFNYQLGYDFNLETGTGERIKNDKQSIGDYALYATAEYKPGVRFTARPGLRVAYNTAYGSPITPSLNLKYHITNTVTARASYARGFRAPSLKELYLFFVDANHNIRPNPDLKAELSDNVNVSVVYSRGISKNATVRVEPAFFYNNIYNMISLAVVDASTQLYNYVNIGRFSNAGANISTQFKNKRVSIQLGTSYTATQNLIDSSTVPKYSNTHEYRAALGYTLPKSQTSFNIFYKYNGKVPGYAVDDNGNVMQTYIQAYSMADLSVSQSFLGQRINVVLGSRNIFNVLRIGYNVPSGTAHSGGGTSMNIGMGRTYFVNIRIHLFKQDK